MATSLPPLPTKSLVQAHPQPADDGTSAAAASAPDVPQRRGSTPTTPSAAAAAAAIVEEEDTTAAALAALRERLPPIKVPVPPVVKMRPTPPALAYAKHRNHPPPAVRPKKLEQQEDIDRVAKAIEKSQSQARSVVEATEQHEWTRLLLSHLHALALLEESVLHRESSGRDALRRDEDRSFALTFVVEHEARLQRIRGRDLVGVQLRKHVMAIEQDDGRKRVAASEAVDFAQLQHREVIYRPVPDAVDAHKQRHVPRRVGGRVVPAGHAAPAQQSSGGGNPAGAMRQPVPPPQKRPVNSARTEERFVANGRIMWGQQKIIREQLNKADAAVAAVPITEQLRREEIEGIELGERLGLERRFFDDHHAATKLAMENRKVEAQHLALVDEAHCVAALQAVDLVMDHVLATTAGTLSPEAYGLSDGVQPSLPPPLKTTSSSALSADRSLGNQLRKGGSSSCQDDLLAVPGTRSRRSSSIVKKIAGPRDQQGMQRLLAEAKQDLAAAQADRAANNAAFNMTILLTPMELVTLVDATSQRLFPAGAFDEWKYSGIATLCLAATQRHLGDATNNSNDGTTTPAVATTTSVTSEVVPTQGEATDQPGTTSQSSEAQSLAPQQERPIEASRQPVASKRTPSPPPSSSVSASRPLFPGIDLLCDVMLDVKDIDDVTPWKMFLSAVLDIEDEIGVEASQRCPFVKRLFDGHRDATLSRDYLEHVLWRTDLHHRNVVNALELIPTRWTTYRNPREFEDEEVEEVVLGEVLARQKIVRKQVDEFCSFLHYAQVKLQQHSNRYPPKA